jgi:hypothetical protein
MLFLFLFELVLSLSYSSGSTVLPQEVNKRIDNVFFNIAENIPNVVQVSITKNQNNLTISDVLPPTINISSSLQAFQNFLNFSTPQNLQISFLNSLMQTTPLTGLNPPFQILPFNVNYTYPSNNWGKTQQLIYCPNASTCNNFSINLNYIINQTFQCNPQISSSCTGVNSYGSNEFSWSPQPDNCAGGPPCINFTLSITDNQGHTYYCPNSLAGTVPCPFYSTSLSGNAATLQIAILQSSVCKFKFTIGGNIANGPVLQMRMLDNNNATCGLVFSNTTFSFNTSSFYVSLPTYLRVSDLGSNTSKTDFIFK